MNTDIVNQAYKHIRKRILSGEFKAGHRLRSEVLAQDLGISRTPLRDALRLLEVDGLVVNRLHQGAMVKYMSFIEFKDLCGVREALECHAVGLAAANRSEAEMEEIRAVLGKLRKLTADFDQECSRDDYRSDLAKGDTAFHMSIIDAARNRLLRAEILRLQIVHRVAGGGLISIYLRPSNLEALRQETVATLEEHTRIVSAIETNDVGKAKSAMEFHLQRIIGPLIERREAEEAMQINADLGYENAADAVLPPG